MKTLYVTDLDGTLLRSDQKTSDFTNQTINELVENGMLFSYATARSYIASKPVTEGLEARIPLIVYNGSMVVDNADGRILLCHYLQEEAHQLLDELMEHDIYPIVFSMIDGVEKMSYVPSKISAETKRFIDMRDGDIRNCMREIYSTLPALISMTNCSHFMRNAKMIIRRFSS